MVNQYELYLRLFKELKKVYLGNIYFELESITTTFDCDNENDIFALQPFDYTLKGRYGRITDEQNIIKLDETFELSFYPDESIEMIAGKFAKLLDN